LKPDATETIGGIFSFLVFGLWSLVFEKPRPSMATNPKSKLKDQRPKAKGQLEIGNWKSEIY